jgi:hypothetical protein
MRTCSKCCRQFNLLVELREHQTLLRCDHEDKTFFERVKSTVQHLPNIMKTNYRSSNNVMVSVDGLKLILDLINIAFIFVPRN